MDYIETTVIRNSKRKRIKKTVTWKRKQLDLY
jgi:hypothetical protein